MDIKLLKKFKHSCFTVLKIKTKPGTMINYAKAYAKAGLSLNSTEEVLMQIPYILSNLGTWKGEEARETKATFKRLEKEIKADAI